MPWAERYTMLNCDIAAPFWASLVWGCDVERNHGEVDILERVQQRIDCRSGVLRVELPPYKPTSCSWRSARW